MWYHSCSHKPFEYFLPPMPEWDRCHWSMWCCHLHMDCHWYIIGMNALLDLFIAWWMACLKPLSKIWIHVILVHDYGWHLTVAAMPEWGRCHWSMWCCHLIFLLHDFVVMGEWEMEKSNRNESMGKIRSLLWSITRRIFDDFSCCECCLNLIVRFTKLFLKRKLRLEVIKVFLKWLCDCLA